MGLDGRVLPTELSFEVHGDHALSGFDMKSLGPRSAKTTLAPHPFIATHNWACIDDSELSRMGFATCGLSQAHKHEWTQVTRIAASRNQYSCPTMSDILAVEEQQS